MIEAKRRHIFKRPLGGRRLLTLVLLLAVLWFGGLAWFSRSLPDRVADAESSSDAIVVLTGGSGRLDAGLALLRSGLGQKLFVSGVYRGVDVRQLLALSQDSPANLACCIALGYEADNTRGNAIETAAWMKTQGYQSLRLVTAAYHMPRSLWEFSRRMPEITVVAHPVFPDSYRQADWWRWPGSARLIISEYHKYLAARIAALIDRGAGESAPW